VAARRNLRISGRTSCVPLRRDRWSSSFGQVEREELNLQLSGEVYQVWRGISRHSIANFLPSGRFPTLRVRFCPPFRSFSRDSLMSLSVKQIAISKHQVSSTIFAPISIISMKKNKDPHLPTGGPLMTRFTLKRNLTRINVEAELHSVPYPLPDSSSVLQNITERFPRYSSKLASANKLINFQNISERFPRYSSKLASIFPGSSPSTKYQFLAA